MRFNKTIFPQNFNLSIVKDLTFQINKNSYFNTVGLVRNSCFFDWKNYSTILFEIIFNTFQTFTDWYKIFNLFFLLNLSYTVKVNLIQPTTSEKIKYQFIYFSVTPTPFDKELTKLITTNPYSINDLSDQQQIELYKNQEFLLKKMDKTFLAEVTTTKSFFYSNCDLYEFNSIAPFAKNLWLNEILYKNLSWLNFFSLDYHLGTYDLATSYYFEPFFFFWEKIQQSLVEFWLVAHFWERALLFDDRVYNPKIVIKDLNHIFPPLSHLAHTSDFKPGFRIVKRLFNHKSDHEFAYYLDFQDLQTYAIDKNFVYLWNYWKGAYNSLNIFSNWKWTGLINFLWEWISSPKLHFPSIYHWTDNAYGSYFTRVLRFGFFPDFAMLWGQFNPNFDWYTSGYNWFFHFGENYIDSSVALDLIRYQITENFWGDFEYIVQDYSAYQSTYFNDNVATIWIPILLLATKPFESQGEMALHIKDYNNVFMFKQIKQYQHFWADIFFKLDWLTKLELLRDSQQIDLRVFHLEKIFNLYFGYNSSFFLANQPIWSVTLIDPYDFYQTLVYDYNEDITLENWERKLIASLHSYDYNYQSRPSIYFKENKFDNFFYNFYRFINEKFFDDSGHSETTFNRGEEYKNDWKFTWLNQLALITCEYIPSSHYTWKITTFGSTPLEWSFTTPNYIEFHFSKFLDALFSGIDVRLDKIIVVDCIFTKGQLHTIHKTLPVLRFGYDFLPIYHFLYDNVNSEDVTWIWKTLWTCVFKFLAPEYQPLLFIIRDHLHPSHFILIWWFLLTNLMEIAALPCPPYNFFNSYKFNANLSYLLDKFFFILININFDIFTFEFQLFKVIYLYFCYFQQTKFYLFLDNLKLLFLDAFLSYEFFEIYIQIFESKDTSSSILPTFAILDKVNITIWVLPLAFFVPIFYLPSTDYLITWMMLLEEGEREIWLPDSSILSPFDLKSIETFFLCKAVIQLNEKPVQFENLDEIINIINHLDYDSLKNNWLEHDRYLNYVIKKNLYKKKS